ncbi:MAG: metallophosphoesterase [Polyangiaceae bacterium]
MSGKTIVQRNWKQAVVLGGAVTFGAGAMPLACSGSASDNGGGGQGSTSTTATPGGSTGSLGFALSLPGGAVISSVTYDLLTSSGTPVILPNAPNPGTVNVGNSAAVDFQLGGVPAAAGDSISLTASVTGGGTCQGSASGITVTAGGTTNVTVQMLCSLPGQDAGNLFVTGTESYCGTWTSLSTTRSEAYVGESLVLTATATGSNPSNLGYTWTMSNPIGAFGATSGGVGAQGQDEGVGPSDPMQFLCTAPGTTTITVVVDDGPTDAGTCPTNLTTQTTTVICDAAPSNQVAAAWVELTGPNGSNSFTGNVAIARAITETSTPDGGANPCPTITINGGTPVQMNLRAASTTSLAVRSVNTPPAKPALFPVNSCEYQLPSGATSAVVAGQSLPLPKAAPTKIVVIGDTGCRLQNGNGTQSCNDPNPNGTDTPYPFAAVAALAAAQNPDLVLHVGDYAYRDNPCPAGQGYNCGGSPWGFGWDTWQADLFAPGAPLLAAAPWIMTRGNHEQCNRAGQGWYRFLDTNPYDTTGVHTCDNPAYDATATGGNWNNPFLVNINSSTQVVVFDTSNAKPQSQSPSLPTGPGSVYYTTYASELTTAGSLIGASPLAFNLWSNHHPIFGYATGTTPTNPIPAFPPVMNSVFPGTYFPPPINLALHGHTHDYQALNFQTGTLPDGGSFQPAATLVSGNAGDILDTALPYPLTGSSVSAVGNPTAVSVATVGGVQQFATSDNGTPYQNPNSSTDNDFGYMVLQFNAGPPATWTSTEYRTDNTVRDVCTVQTSGQISCASWGVIQPDDAGVY